jgi:branched-chain amino acid transport system substrate-binding protein
VLGSIGTGTGVLGQLMLPIHQTARLWVSDVNARGGLNGHPVRLVVGDDGGDPSKALTLAKQMVDQDKVVAFYAEHGPTTMQAILPFLEQKKIPIIGGCNCNNAVAHSPMGFDVGPGGDRGIAWAHVAPLVALSPSTEKRKVSVLYCREVATCQAIRNGIRAFAPGAGIDIVHEAQVSLSQPDFTAEVVAARNAGAQAFLLAVDNFSVIRVARSAHRQGFKVPLVAQYSPHDERFVKDGGADVDGTLIGASVPHWDSPKMADFRTAVQRFQPNLVKASTGMQNWVAGKLIEVISRQFPDQVTSADFLKGLYGLRGETLGGLIPPITYREGQGTDGNSLCVVPLRVESGKFTAPNGDNYTCAPGWKPVTK